MIRFDSPSLSRGLSQHPSIPQLDHEGTRPGRLSARSYRPGFQSALAMSPMEKIQPLMSPAGKTSKWGATDMAQAATRICSPAD